MNLPAMVYSDGIRKHKQVKFGGLNHTKGAADGELYDMRNLCSDDYPLLSVRPQRLVIRKLEKPNGLFYWKGLLWVDGTDVYFDGEVVGQVEDSKKTFGALGPYIVIMPDKVCYHVEEKTMMPMEKTWERTDNWTHLRVMDAYDVHSDYDAQVNVTKHNAISVRGRPDMPDDDGENPAPDFSTIFRIGDSVRVTGTVSGVTKSVVAVIREFYRNTARAGYVGNNGETMYYGYSQIIFDEGSLKSLDMLGFDKIAVTREVPDMKYLCEDGNRLWGCTGDTIHACKLGDPFNWNVFDLLETDSWALTPASSGEFTGCINYQGYPTFFKEDRLYKVYGQTPSAFSVVDSPCLGVAAGCGGTLALAWGYVFYLGTNGPMVYTGSLPRPVSDELGGVRLVGGSAGSDGLKYYAALRDPGGEARLYVYDVQRGMWHIEDEMEVLGFCRVDGDLYCLGADGTLQILGTAKNAPEEAVQEAAVGWMAEFSDFTHDDPNHKGVSKLQLRLGLEKGSRVTVLIQFDSDGVWRQVRTLIAPTLVALGDKRSYYLPIVPRRCDHYRIRLEGAGRASVYSMVRESYSGSEHPAR